MIEIRYRKSSDDLNSEVDCVINDITQTSKMIDGLEPLTSYSIRIRAGNAVGNSSFSSDVTFSTFGECIQNRQSTALTTNNITTAAWLRIFSVQSVHVCRSY